GEAHDVPRARGRIALVNVASDCVRLVAKDESLGRLNLFEVFHRVHAHECAGRTVLFTRIGFATHARRIHRRAFAQVALDRDHVIRWTGCRCIRNTETENPREVRHEAFIVYGRVTRHHRDRVVRALRGAVETTDTTHAVDIDLAQRIAKNSARRTTSHTLRIGAVHTHLRHQRVLEPLLANS